MSDTGYIDRILLQAANFKSNAAEAEYDAALEAKRPFMLLRPRISIDESQWCVLYGENIQDGVTGFGTTPHEASIDFDLAWFNQKAKVKP